MPRVSADHLEARRRQILDAARRCFAANGFHSTSMQDILRESELSAGAVYRYFPGKEDIIAAIAEEALSTIAAAVDHDPDGDQSILELLESVLQALDDFTDRNDVGRLALQVWAEAARTEALRDRIATNIAGARAAVAARLRRQHGDDIDAESAAAVFLALLPGYLHARVMVGDMTPARYLAGFRELSALAAAGD